MHLDRGSARGKGLSRGMTGSCAPAGEGVQSLRGRGPVPPVQARGHSLIGEFASDSPGPTTGAKNETVERRASAPARRGGSAQRSRACFAFAGLFARSQAQTCTASRRTRASRRCSDAATSAPPRGLGPLLRVVAARPSLSALLAVKRVHPQVLTVRTLSSPDGAIASRSSSSSLARRGGRG